MPRVLQEQWVPQVPQVVVPLDHKDRPEQQVPQDFLELRVPLDSKVPQVRVPLVPLDLKGHKDHKALLDLLDHKDHADHKDHKDHKDP